MKRRSIRNIVIMAVIAVVILIIKFSPSISDAHIARNERIVIDSLWGIVDAQKALQESGAIDTDSDGVGEFGFFADLLGESKRNKTRFFSRGSKFEFVNKFGFFVKQGYFLRIFLPHTGTSGVCTEAPKGGVREDDVAEWGSDATETLWCCYAWPFDYGEGGRRSFFINQDGILLETRSEFTEPPECLSVFSRWRYGMAGSIAVGEYGMDGTRWRPIEY